MDKCEIPQWRQILKSVRRKEEHLPSSKWIQLATINENHEPRLRTVVFREWIDNTSFIIFTDRRSEKVIDIKENKSVEILWLFSKSKSQFRFKGKAEFIHDSKKYWNKLSEKSKEKWFWPHPGKIREEFSLNNISFKSSAPYDFLVIKINIEITELLELTKPFHKRYLWGKDNNWKLIELNP